MTLVLGLLMSACQWRYSRTPTQGQGFPRFLVRELLAVTTLQMALKTSEAIESRMAGRKVTELEGWHIKGGKLLT